MAKAIATPQPRNPVKEEKLKKLLEEARTPFIWVAVFSLAANLLMLALPLYTLQVLDRVLSSFNLNTLLMLTIVAVGCLAFFAIFTAIRGTVLARIGEWLQNVLGPKLMKTAVENSACSIPASASQFHRELGAIRGFITGMGVSTLFDAPWSIIFLLAIYMINPLLGFMALGGAIFLILFAFVVEYSTKKPIDKSTELTNRSLQYVESVSRNAEAVEAMGMLTTLVKNWKEANQHSMELQGIANNRSNILLSLSRFIRLLLQVGIMGAGSWLAIQGELSVGGMIAASILTGRALAPFENAISIWKQWISARDAYHRLESAMSDLPQLRGTMPMPAPGGTLTVENLIYTPPQGKMPIIKNINFKLQARESLGLIGPSAAGKSTLARLLMGIKPPTHGAVRLDGVDIFQWNRDDLGQYVGYLPQNVELFPGTIKDNIARMDLDAKPEDVIKAAQFAGCHEMILRLPQGYETQYSKNNLSLSPGQCQRIGLARALYGNPSFVVLDEPNINLDGEGEVALQQAISRMKQAGITLVLVAHKPSIVANVDKILMLQEGAIKDFGPREEVLKKYLRPAPKGDQKAEE